MGKYRRKSELTGDMLAVMDVSHSSLGVRTRAKTLAMQKLQASTTPPPPEKHHHHHLELSYLQLRSRRLEKPPFRQLMSCCTQQNPNPSFMNSSGSMGSSQIKAGEGTEESCYFGAEEASFGENNIDADDRERSSRESTPCSSVKDLNSVSTPGSITRSTNLEASNQNSVRRSMPLEQEIEAFFAHHEQEQRRWFSEKYNFDFVNEKPLEGHYEWVKVRSQ